jgi:hypothetical protein
MIKRLTTTVPPESGGLNVSYNTVKEVKHTEKKYNGRYRQSASKRASKRT